MSHPHHLERFHALDATRAFAVLFASCHYLVRSTFIGRMLNGQSYPFVAWPFARPARRPGSAAESEGSVPKQESRPQSTHRS